MAEPPSPVRGVMVTPPPPPSQQQQKESFASNLAADARASPRGFQPAAKRLKGAEERGLKGPKRVNGEGGSSSNRQPPPPHIPMAPTPIKL